jgi:thiamine transport system permease protein
VSQRRLGRNLLFWLAPLAFLAVFFFYPLSATLRLAWTQAAVKGLPAQTWPLLGRTLGFTVYQAALSTILTLLLGLPAAYIFARVRFAGKGFLRVLITLPFILPTVVVAAAFNALLGPNGWVNLGLMAAFNLASPPLQVMNTLGIILLAHVFYNTAVVVRVVGGAWSCLDPRLEQAARCLGAPPWRVLREVTLPLMRPSILAATVLVFLFDFTSFGVILMLGGPQFSTLEVEIYTQTMQLFNLPLAGLLSAVQLGCTLLLAVGYSRLGGGVVPLSPRLQGEGLRPARTWARKLAVGVIAALLGAILVLPLLGLAARSFTRFEANRGERGAVATGFTLDYYRELFINRRGSLFYVPPAEAARNSLAYAAAAVGFSLLLGSLAAYALSKRQALNRWLDPLLMLPLGASAVTLGLGFLLVFNHPPLDVRSFPLLIPIAHSLVALPMVVRTIQPALASIPPNLPQAAAVLGASPWQVWLKVELPIIARPALAGAIFAFTVSLGEFGATSFLARPEYPTLPVAIYRYMGQPGALNYGQALAMATLLMLVCALSVAALERLNLPGGDGIL